MDIPRYIVSNIKKINHSTSRFTEESKEHFDEIQEYIPGYVLPAFGEFPTKLDILKYFTVTKGCYYYCNSMVFLEYDVLRPLVLVNMIEIIKQSGLKDINEINAYRNALVDMLSLIDQLDGYIDGADCIELSLFRANECVGDYRIIEHEQCDYDHDKELAVIMS